MDFPEAIKEKCEEMVVQSIICFERKFVANPLNYAIDNKGYIYCKRCGKRVQTEVKLFGKTYRPFCLGNCICDNEN